MVNLYSKATLPVQNIGTMYQIMRRHHQYENLKSPEMDYFVSTEYTAWKDWEAQNHGKLLLYVDNLPLHKWFSVETPEQAVFTAFLQV